MSIQKLTIPKQLKVIARSDSGLPSDLSDENYKLYQETLDEKHLGLAEDAQVTRFIMRGVLDFNEQMALRDAMMVMKGKDDAQIKLSATLLETRMALCGIENHPECENPLVFKLDEDKLASLELCAELASQGVLDQIGTTRTTFLKSQNKAEGLRKK